MWIAAGELEDAIGIYTEELMRIGARAVAMETEPTSGAPRLRFELSDDSGDFIVVLPSATPGPDVYVALAPAACTKRISVCTKSPERSLVGLWSEIELERRRRPEVAEIVL